jgi:hypothetical protein
VQFPLSHANVAACGGYDAFITKLDPEASSLTFSTCIEGPGLQHVIRVNAFGVDRFGDAVVAGYANNPEFPLVNPLLPEFQGFGGIVVKLAILRRGGV